jgi:hypothetical protein
MPKSLVSDVRRVSHFAVRVEMKRWFLFGSRQDQGALLGEAFGIHSMRTCKSCSQALGNLN